MKAYQGNTLQEYMLLAGLVGIACVAGVLVLGTSFDEFLGQALNQMSQNPGAVSVVNNTGAGNAAGPQAPAKDSSSSSSPESQSLCFSSGQCINPPATYSQDTETAGGRGSQKTKTHASTLEQIAQDLKNIEDIDHEVVNLITDLARYGHILASGQQTVETDYDLYCSQYDCNNLSHSEAEACATYTSMLSADEHVQDFNVRKQKLDEYLSSHPGSLPDGITQIIDQESGRINNIASQYQVQENASGTVAINIPKDGSGNTQTASNNVCESGGDQGQCIENGF